MPMIFMARRRRALYAISFAIVFGLVLVGGLTVWPVCRLGNWCGAPTVPEVAQLITEQASVLYQPPGGDKQSVPRGSTQNIQAGDVLDVGNSGKALLSFSDFLQVRIFRNSKLRALPDRKSTRLNSS